MTENREKFFVDLVSIFHNFFSDLNDVCKKYNPEHNEGTTKKSKSSKKSNDPNNESSIIKKRKKIKKPVDPNAPKKPVTSPWILYYQDRKDQLIKEYPDYELKAISRIISKEWQNIPEDKKKPYLDKIKKNTKDYKEKLEEYNKSINNFQGTNKIIPNDVMPFGKKSQTNNDSNNTIDEHGKTKPNSQSNNTNNEGNTNKSTHHKVSLDDDSEDSDEESSDSDDDSSDAEPKLTKKIKSD